MFCMTLWCGLPVAWTYLKEGKGRRILHCLRTENMWTSAKFLCISHGDAAAFVGRHGFPTNIIILSNNHIQSRLFHFDSHSRYIQRSLESMSHAYFCFVGVPTYLVCPDITTGTSNIFPSWTCCHERIDILTTSFITDKRRPEFTYSANFSGFHAKIPVPSFTSTSLVAWYLPTVAHHPLFNFLHQSQHYIVPHEPDSLHESFRLTIWARVVHSLSSPGHCADARWILPRLATLVGVPGSNRSQWAGGESRRLRLLQLYCGDPLVKGEQERLSRTLFLTRFGNFWAKILEYNIEDW